MKKILIYIFPLILGLFSSCKDDMTLENASPDYESDGSYLSVSVDVPEIRTRAVDLTPGAALYLKKIWVGIYDVESGARVGGTNEGIDLGNRYASSGTQIIDLVKISINNGITINRNNKYCVVGVANYDGIKTIGGVDLYTELKDATDWSKFVNIAIDSKNSDFENQSPLLVGYLSKETEDYGLRGFVKVDQTKTETGTTGVYLFDNDEIQQTDNNIFVGIKNNRSGLDTKYTLNGEKNYVLKLRRMRSKVNVLINETPVDGITITKLEYKLVNIPKSAFIVPRRTNDFGEDFKDPDSSEYSSKYSSNSSDVKFTGNEGYEESDWIPTELSTSFSFEHFENKHWAKNNVWSGITKKTDESNEEFNSRKYHERELNEGGKYKALVDSENSSVDWNNNASYFILKMSILDRNTGRNAEVEYTIHEGFINNKFGVNSTDIDTRLYDFSCIRNTDYFYHVTVNGINDIVVQVTEENSHSNDERGKVWQINYLNKKSEKDPNYIKTKTGIEIASPLILKNDADNDDADNKKVKNSDIAFRLVGSVYDKEALKESKVDICYNFNRGELEGFSGLWPSPSNVSTEYIVETGEEDQKTDVYTAFKNFIKEESTNAKNYDVLKDKIQIKYAGEYITLTEYVEKLSENNSPNIEGFKFDGLRFYEKFDPTNDDERDHLYGLYIFDREKALNNGLRIKTDADADIHNEEPCSFLYQINGIEQYPVYLESEIYEMVYPAGKTHIQPTPTQSDYTGFSDKHNGTGMLLSQYPDFAFRAVGFIDNDNPDLNTTDYFDIWYNILPTDYEYYYSNDPNDVWPGKNLNNTEFKYIEKGMLDPNSLSDDFLEGIKIIVNGTETYDLYTFITQYEKGAIKLAVENGDGSMVNKKLGFQVNKNNLTVRVPQSNQTEKNFYNQKYMRALYFMDKKNKFLEPALLNEDAATYQVYAIEQDPNLNSQIQLPDPAPGYNTNNMKSPVYNIIDPEIGVISVPVLIKDGKTVPYDKYRIQIFGRSGTGAERSVIMEDLVPNGNGNYTFNVPMYALGGSSGNLHIQAISTDGSVLYSEEYSNSDKKAVSSGSYTLTSPPVWNSSNANNDLGRVLNNNSSGNFNDVTQGYLTFSGGNFSRQTNDNTTVLRFGQNASTLSFKIYKPCKITVTKQNNGINIGLDGMVVKTIPAGADSKTKATDSYTVKDADFKGKTVLTVSLQRTGSGSADVSIIQVEEP